MWAVVWFGSSSSSAISGCVGLRGRRGVERAIRARVGAAWRMEKVEGSIKPSSEQGYSTSPAWKGIRGLHKICRALWLYGGESNF